MHCCRIMLLASEIILNWPESTCSISYWLCTSGTSALPSIQDFSQPMFPVWKMVMYKFSVVPLNVTFFYFSIGRVICLLSWTLYICLVLTCYHIWLPALPPRHQLSLITDIWRQTHWAHNCTTFSQHLNKHIERRKVTDHCRLVNHISPLSLFSV